ncbi:hypothetical protein SRO_3432 [Streptomyces rochei]|nr:hypothetical protein SRO_3432 [Streptomyces rochei]
MARRQGGHDAFAGEHAGDQFRGDGTEVTDEAQVERAREDHVGHPGRGVLVKPDAQAGELHGRRAQQPGQIAQAQQADVAEAQVAFQSFTDAAGPVEGRRLGGEQPGPLVSGDGARAPSQRAR